MYYSDNDYDREIEVEDDWDAAHRLNEEYDNAVVAAMLEAEDRANRRIMCAGTY
jgi:hypothetical protein